MSSDQVTPDPILRYSEFVRKNVEFLRCCEQEQYFNNCLREIRWQPLPQQTVADYGADGGYIVGGLPLRAFYTENARRKHTVKLPLSIYAHRGLEPINPYPNHSSEARHSDAKTGTREGLEARQPGETAWYKLKPPELFANQCMPTYVSFPRYLYYRTAHDNRPAYPDFRWNLRGDPVFETQGAGRLKEVWTQLQSPQRYSNRTIALAAAEHTLFNKNDLKDGSPASPELSVFSLEYGRNKYIFHVKIELRGGRGGYWVPALAADDFPPPFENAPRLVERGQFRSYPPSLSAPTARARAGPPPSASAVQDQSRLPPAPHYLPDTRSAQQGPPPGHLLPPLREHFADYFPREPGHAHNSNAAHGTPVAHDEAGTASSGHPVRARMQLLPLPRDPDPRLHLQRAWGPTDWRPSSLGHRRQKIYRQEPADL